MVVLLVTSSNNSPASPKREPEPPLNSPVIVPMSTFVPLTNPPAPNATQVLPNAPQVFSTVAQAPPSSVPAAVVPVVVQVRLWNAASALLHELNFVISGSSRIVTFDVVPRFPNIIDSFATAGRRGWLAACLRAQ